MKVDPKTAPAPEPRTPSPGEPPLTRSQRRKLLAKLTADQRREELKAEKDARRAARVKAEWERRGDNMGR